MLKMVGAEDMAPRLPADRLDPLGFSSPLEE
jgi:hypothetical protein